MEHLQQKQQRRGKNINVMGLFVGIGLGVVFVILLCPSVNAQSLINPTLVHPQINQGIMNGNGFQQAGAGGCLTAPTAGSSCLTPITWSTPMPTNNYNVYCDCNGGVGEPVLGNLFGQTQTGISITTFALTNVAAQCGSIICIAVAG